ncbi:DUF1015 family protein [Streptomyces syringium]|uniref:DUF1015 family protein n=1 Tax=Streptomyces syringium TaxID=76729 RepID=UPI003415E330
MRLTAPGARAGSPPLFHPIRGVFAEEGHAAEGTWAPNAAPVGPTRAVAPTPDYYMLEQRRSDAVLQRGLVGAVDLAAVASRRLHKHEGVSDAHVTVQEQLLHHRGGNDEPILLMAQSLGAVSDYLDHLAATPPDSVMTAADGTEQRIWACRNLAMIAEALRLADPHLLVADGHHRLEAALRFHRSRDNDGSGPASRILAVAVDSSRFPPTLSAIHRTVPDIDIEQAVRTASRFARVRRLPPRLEPPQPGHLVLCGEGQVWEVSQICRSLAESRLRELPRQWHDLDAALATHVLIPELCAAQSVERPFSYTHALPSPTSRGRLGVVLPRPTLTQIWQCAESGVALPRKSTSFTPKPMPGQISYLFEHERFEHGAREVASSAKEQFGWGQHRGRSEAEARRAAQ